MKEDQETSIQWWRRNWHLHKGDVRIWGMVLLLAALVFAFYEGLDWLLRELTARVDRSNWWTSLAPTTQYLILGISIEGLGWFFLKIQIKNRRRTQTFLDLRVFLGQIAMIIVGIVLIWRAAFL